MLGDIRTSLTEAVVTGPGKAVLFYGRHSMGDGLTAYEARDTTFLLTGAGRWAGKLAYLAIDPMTIHECWWAITQAVTDHPVKARGPGHPCVNLLAQQPFRFDCTKGSPIKDTSGDGGSDHQPSPHQHPRGQDCNRCHHLPWTEGLRVTGAHYQCLPQCYPGLIDQTDPGIPDEGDNTKRMELTWR